MSCRIFVILIELLEIYILFEFVDRVLHAYNILPNIYIYIYYCNACVCVCVLTIGGYCVGRDAISDCWPGLDMEKNV